MSVDSKISEYMKRNGVGRITAVRELINSGSLYRDDSGKLKSRGPSGRTRIEWEKRKKYK